MTNKDRYIREISSLCKSKYGSLLLQLMDIYNKTSLDQITENQAKEYLEKLKIQVPIFDLNE